MLHGSRHLQDSPEQVFRRRVLERVSVAFGGLLFLGIVARYLSSPIKPLQALFVVFVAGIVMATPWLTKRLRTPGLAAAPVCVAFLLLVAGTGWKHGGLGAPMTAVLPLLPLLAFCFGGKRLAVATLCGSFLLTLGLYEAGQSGLVEPIQDVVVQPRNTLIVFSLLAIAAFMIGSIYEKSRRIAEQHLVEASRLASLGVMAGGVAHEINNSLMIADSFARFLVDQARQGEVDPKEVERLASHVVASTARMAAIVSGLRIYSRDDARDALAPVEVARIVEDALALCRERFKSAGITLRVGPIPAGCAVLARPVQLGQVLLNVLNNAFDAVAEAPERAIDLEFGADGRSSAIRVADSGAGVPRELRAQIFIPFFTSKAIGKGVGLGLSVSASILAEHGGDIFLDESRPRTTFVIRLPAAPTRVSRAA